MRRVAYSGAKALLCRNNYSLNALYKSAPCSINPQACWADINLSTRSLLRSLLRIGSPRMLCLRNSTSCTSVARTPCALAEPRLIPAGVAQPRLASLLLILTLETPTSSRQLQLSMFGCHL